MTKKKNKFKKGDRVYLSGTRKKGTIYSLDKHDIYKDGAYILFDGQQLMWFVPEDKINKIKE
jgi:hypothetical protein